MQKWIEERSSEYSVHVLDDIGHAWAIPSFTLFFRADLEAMTIFHRHGHAPIWPDFLSRWKTEVASGDRRIQPFAPRPVPKFQPVHFETQAVKQERDGRSDTNGAG